MVTRICPKNVMTFEMMSRSSVEQLAAEQKVLCDTREGKNGSN